jgi:hypothetical protein
VQRADPALIDAAIIFAGLIWFVIRPGFGPMIFLTVLQIAALIINLNALDTLPENSPEEKAVAANILLRIIFISLVARGVYAARKQSSSDPQTV